MIYFADSDAKIVLPELITKQSTNNLRLITQNGKFTYYQKKSGSLYFSTNYKVSELIKGQADTQYTVIAGDEHKKIIISQDENFHNYFSLRNPENIFLADYGSLTLHKIGKGLSPRLHLQDTWLSYYQPSSQILTFENTVNSALKFSIRLNNKMNPYFIPDVVMPYENTVYYTDLSDTANPGIVEYRRSTHKTALIYQAKTPLMKLELCYSHSSLFLIEMGINSSTVGSTISQYDLPFKTLQDKSIIYNSALNDLGHLVCNYSKDSVYFIKNVGTANISLYDIAEVNLDTKKLSILSDFKNSTSLFNMDGTLLTFDNGSYFILKGKADFKTIDSLKSTPSKLEDKAKNNE